MRTMAVVCVFVVVVVVIIFAFEKVSQIEKEIYNSSIF